MVCFMHKKVSITPIKDVFDISDVIKSLHTDMDFKLEKDRQYEELVNKESKNQSKNTAKVIIAKKNKK